MSSTTTFDNLVLRVSPKFHAHKNGSDQTIPTGAFTKVTFGTETFDTNNNFASSTFTPTVAGKYRVTASVRWNSLADGNTILLQLYKNGTEIRRITDLASGAANFNLMISDLVDMNGASDTLEIYAFHNNAGSKDIEGDAVNTWFCGELAH